MASEAGKKKGLIEKPGPRLGKNAPLKFVKKGGGKKSGYAELNLTSMVDMLTILVVFLLQTFSASGELSAAKNIVLPDAVNSITEIERSSMIGVSKDAVTLDGQPVANSEELARGDSSDWKITELNDQLVTLRNNWKLLHPNEDWKGTIIVQADRGVDFKVIKKVLYTCSVAGYPAVNFLVNSKGKGG